MLGNERSVAPPSSRRSPGREMRGGPQMKGEPEPLLGGVDDLAALALDTYKDV
jgi:hypothetical protein